MGAEVEAQTYSRSARSRYRELLADSAEQLRAYLVQDGFSERGMIGLELELNLVDEANRPAMVNADVLQTLGEHGFDPELGRFTIELNHPTVEIAGTGLRELEDSLREKLLVAHEHAARHGAFVVPVGILPSVLGDDIVGDEWISPGNRFAALNDAILTARGEDILIDIHGADEHLSYYAQDIAAEATCTSMQIHLEVTRERFGAVWNAAQCIAGAQIALAANSPLFLGSRLWHETRIPVFQQAIDDRAPEYARQGVRPRVWFGERWISGIEELFAENVDYFPALLPEQSEGATTTGRGAPLLPELNLHNGTVYRWNRPIYDPGNDQREAHLRVENRLLPAGPTVLDMTANTAFFFGAVRYLVDSEENPWERMSFRAAADGFYRCARQGLEASVYWPGFGDVPVAELLDRHLLPAAEQGLISLGVDQHCIDRYLGVLTGRTRNGQNGATWMTRTLARLEEGGLARRDALGQLVGLYREHAVSSAAVHTWPLPQ